MSDDTKYPPVLDACCGTRAFWFDKEDRRAVFHDKRNGELSIRPDKSHPARNLIVRPNVVGDFIDLKFPSNTFALVVFDPPHIQGGEARERGVIGKTFGLLPVGWKEMLRKGFSECFRVLRPEGVLVFKWCEVETPLREVLALTPERPLFGHKVGKMMRTHWIAFLKPNVVNR